ncbi:LysR family transcriptional regulator [Cupriavidus sp. NPDC089707]|uniref:LysR family transcriptional regulator n=1 Tax=Cupriavidus sp. NPDC089707 TaxID=3363963 RepID=UPI0037F3F4E9
MDLRKLRHVLVLAEELNFARAAMSLHLTQPALSRSIRALEDELGCQLFDRDGQGVRITPVGRQVAERARALLMDARSLQQEVDMMLRREVGHVRMGSGPLPLAALLPPVMAELAREHPRLRVEIENHSAAVLMQMLLDGVIEFFVADLSAFGEDSRIATRRLAEENIRAYCRANHPLVGRPVVRPKDLLDYPILSGRRPAESEDSLARYFGLETARPLPMHLISDFVPLLISVTLESDAVLLAVNTAVRAELDGGSLVALNLSPPLDRVFDIGIVSLAGWTLSPAAEWLIERLHSVASKAADRHCA